MTQAARARPSVRARLAIVAIVSIGGFAATAAAALPGDDPDHVSTVADLAYRLGEAHWARRACRGPDENTWRQAMAQVMLAEKADDAQKARLARSFNAGYLAASASSPGCDPAVEVHARLAAEKIARRLAQEVSAEKIAP